MEIQRYGMATRALVLLLFLHGCLAVEVNESSSSSSSSSGGGDSLTILRCCRAGEDLDKPWNIAEDEDEKEEEVKCVPSNETFNMLIYSSVHESLLSRIPDSWIVREGVRPSCLEPMELRYVPHNRNNPFVLFETGDIILEAGLGANLRPEEYCLGSKTLLACLPKRNESHQAASRMRPKVQKCCGENAAYEKNSCVSIEGEHVTSLEDEKLLLLGTNNSNLQVIADIEIVRGFPDCPNLTIIGNVTDALVQPDASLLVDGQHIPTGQFCIERVRSESHQLLPAKVFACSEHAGKGSGVSVRDIRFTLYPVGFIISAIFLAATLAAGCLLPASHHVLHWRCQTHHVACLMLGDIFMAVIQLAGNSLEGNSCKAVAILAHFFFLATFFWLNTMCFNIWWTFRDLRPASLEKGQEQLRLWFYAAYAWGGPLIVAGLAAILDHLPQTPGHTFLRPRFGEKQCWFFGDMEILAYFFGPIGVLLAINLLFFAATARELTCGLWKGEFVKSTTERSRAIPRTHETARDRSNRRAALGKVCLKLVVVMGVPWIFDVISWMAGGPAFLWYVTDLCNAAQGVLIFIVVGCQPQVRAAIKRFWSRNPRANAKRQGNGLSTTSHGMPSMGDSVTQNPSTKTAPLETIC